MSNACELILSRPGRRRYIKAPVPAAADKHDLYKTLVCSETGYADYETALVSQSADSYTNREADLFDDEGSSEK